MGRVRSGARPGSDSREQQSYISVILLGYLLIQVLSDVRNILPPRSPATQSPDEAQDYATESGSLGRRRSRIHQQALDKTGLMYILPARRFKLSHPMSSWAEHIDVCKRYFSLRALSMLVVGNGKSKYKGFTLFLRSPQLLGILFSPTLPPEQRRSQAAPDARGLSDSSAASQLRNHYPEVTICDHDSAGGQCASGAGGHC